jgi:hypothetical protein
MSEQDETRKGRIKDPVPKGLRVRVPSRAPLLELQGVMTAAAARFRAQ